MSCASTDLRDHLSTQGVIISVEYLEQDHGVLLKTVSQIMGFYILFILLCLLKVDRGILH